MLKWRMTKTQANSASTPTPQSSAADVAAEYLATQTPGPSQASLSILLATVTRARLLQGGVDRGRALGEIVLLDENDPRAIATLRDCLVIDESTPAAHCTCPVGFAIELYSSDRLAATLGLHYNGSIRWDTTWKHDAVLHDRLRLLWWMASRGCSAPLAVFETERTRAEAAQLAADRWYDAMPACLKPHWEDMQNGNIEPAALHLALSQAVPEPDVRIRVLLSWLSSGLGIWSGYPEYERLAEELLTLEETPAIVRALENTVLTSQLIAGTARYFASGHFQQNRLHELRLVPERLKAQLLAYGLTPASANIRERAMRAFGVGSK